MKPRQFSIIISSVLALSACGAPQPSPRAFNPPSVTLSAAASSTPQGAVNTFTATVVKGSGTITRVDFLDANDLVIGSDSIAPYEYAYVPSPTTPLGEWTFTARVSDSNNYIRKSSPIKITVTAAPVGAPTITLTANPTSVVRGTSSLLTATVTAGTATITKVEFFDANGNLLGSDTSPPYELRFSTTANTALGATLLSARVTDSSNATALSAAVVVTVTAAPLAAPEITLGLSDSTISQGEATTLTAIVTKGTGTVQKVEFLDSNNATLGSDTSEPYEYTYATTSNTALGDRAFTAQVTDSNALSATSNSVKVTVTAAPAATFARARVVHGIVDTGSMDVRVNNAVVAAFNNLAFGQGSVYASVSANTTTVQVFSTGTTTNPFVNSASPLVANADHTMVAIGTMFASGPGGTAPGLMVLNDNNTAPSSGKVKIRVVHAASSQLSQDVYLSSANVAPTPPALYNNVRFNTPSDYVYREINPGTYQVSFFAVGADPGSAPAILSVTTPTLTAGKVYTVLKLNPTPGSPTPSGAILLTDN